MVFLWALCDVVCHLRLEAVRVKLLSTDEKGRMRLSIKAAKAEEGDVPAAAPQAPGAGDATSQQQQQQQQ